LLLDNQASLLLLEIFLGFMQAAKSLSSLLQQRSLSVFLFVGDVFHLIGPGGGTTARCLVEVELLVWSYIHDVFWLRWDGLASRFHYILA